MIPSRRTRWNGTTSAFTLIELLVVLGVIALLIGILLPTLAAARAAARQTACSSNLRQIGIGVFNYQTDYDGWGPAIYFGWTSHPGQMTSRVVLSYDDMIDPYFTQAFTLRERMAENAPGPNPVYVCPSDEVERLKWPSDLQADIDVTGLHVRSYMINANVAGGAIFGGTRANAIAGHAVQTWNVHYRLEAIAQPADVILVAEAPWKFNTLGGNDTIIRSPRHQANQARLVEGNPGHTAIPTSHGTTWNYLFVDGTVRRFAPEETVTPNGGAIWLDRVTDITKFWTPDPND